MNRFIFVIGERLYDFFFCIWRVWNEVLIFFSYFWEKDFNNKFSY